MPSLTTTEVPTNATAMPDSLLEMRAKALWSSSAPSAVRDAWNDDSEGESWQAWQKALAKRASVCLSDTPIIRALGWAAGESEAKRPLAKLQAALSAKSNAAAVRLATDRIERSAVREPTINVALELVAWCYLAPAFAERLDALVWWRLVDRLREQVELAGSIELGESPDIASFTAQQLAAGEAGVVLALLLDEIKPLRALRKPSAKLLSEGLLAMTDGEGLPPARALDGLPLLLACWIRAESIAAEYDKTVWGKSADGQFEWLVRQSLRLAHGDGSIPLSHGERPPSAMWRELLEIAGDESDEAAAATRLKPLRGDFDTDADLPEPSANSEWSGLSVLSAGWRPKAPRLTVTYDDGNVRLEIATGGRVISSAVWPVDVQIDGRQVESNGEWEEQCWFADEDSDYLELSVDLKGGGKLERQILLARDGSIAYLSEIVLSQRSEPVTIEIATRLRLNEGVQWQGEKETREGYLSVSKDRLMGVAPLALPEWRIDLRGGELAVEGDELKLTHHVLGRNACSPLVLDFKPKRFAKACTWRQLTVASQLERVQRDVAVGFRYQSGKQQWMVYRSLDRPANRTILGQNYSCEGVIGRFESTGEVDDYFEIE